MNDSRPNSTSRILLYAAYGLTVALMIVAYLMPDLRLWGLNFASFLPPWFAVIMLALLIIAPFIAGRITADCHITADTRTINTTAIILAVIAGVAYYLFRTQSHFLGDGYQILSLISQDQPFIKPIEYGEMIVHLILANLIGGEPEQAALTAYRILSISGGVGVILILSALASRLFDTRCDRLLFMLGVLTSGSSLLFFGYVENYTLLILGILATLTIGLLTIDGRLNRWLILLPFAASVFFHLLGLVMLPCVLYVLARDSAVSRWFMHTSRTVRFTLWILLAAIVAVIAFTIYTDNLFLRLAVLPLLPNQLSIPGYLLFSQRHLIDCANLLLVLLPGLLVLLSSLIVGQNTSILRTPSRRFLAIASVTSLIAAFILDPKLGMPRDWDLFAFVAIPISMLLYMIVLKSKHSLRHHAVILAVALSTVMLSSRVAVFTTPDASLKYAAYMHELDRLKTRNLWYVMINYHRDNGNEEMADSLRTQWRQRFPELTLMRQAFDAYHRADFDESLRFCRLAIQRNPTYADAWINAGAAFQAMNRLDSAAYYLEVARGLSPNTPSVYVNLAAVLIERGRYDRAERLLRDAEAIDSTKSSIYYHLGRIEGNRGNVGRYVDYLAIAARKPDVTLPTLREYIVAAMLDERTANARAAFQYALTRGLDSASVQTLLTRFPELGK